jgi:hypothetical protein
MESTTLIPYSVHLRRDIHAKLKAAAGDRKAAGLVRDAITSYIEGGSLYDSGYKAGLLDAIAIINKNESANLVAIGGETFAELLTRHINFKIPATPKAKNGNKKTTR